MGTNQRADILNYSLLTTLFISPGHTASKGGETVNDDSKTKEQLSRGLSERTLSSVRKDYLLKRGFDL